MSYRNKCSFASRSTTIKELEKEPRFAHQLMRSARMTLAALGPLPASIEASLTSLFSQIGKMFLWLSLPVVCHPLYKQHDDLDFD
ncbi:unnamed protein product [Caretta caretta]